MISGLRLMLKQHLTASRVLASAFNQRHPALPKNMGSTLRRAGCDPDMQGVRTPKRAVRFPGNGGLPVQCRPFDSTRSFRKAAATSIRGIQLQHFGMKVVIGSTPEVFHEQLKRF